MRILVTGAGGYIGGRLIPRLLTDGHDVRAAFRSPVDLGRFAWSDRTDNVPLDLADEIDTAAAVDDMEAVYYLVHGLQGEHFAETDRRAATNLVHAASAAGVTRIVYLSGLIPPADTHRLSDHLSSRLEVERVLTDPAMTTITVRAAIVIGSGSTSFEIIRQVSERMPVHVVPSWMTAQVQPIAVTDVVEALAGALTVDSASRSYDIGGDEELTYGELLARYAAVAGLRRSQPRVAFAPTALVAAAAGRLVDVPTATVASLVRSLQHDMVCGENDFTSDLLPSNWRRTSLDDAIRRSLAGAADSPVAERDPLGPLPHDPDWSDGGRDRRGITNLAVRTVSAVGTVASLSAGVGRVLPTRRRD